MYLKYSIDLQSTQEKRDKEKERKRNGKRNKGFKTYRGRVDACTLHVAVSDHCCTCTNLWVHRVFYMPWFHLFDVYIQWKKKRKRKGAMETRLDRVVHCTPVLHTRGFACARTYTLAHAHTGTITSLMIYPTESSLLLRCNGERRRFARECWREKKQHRGRHKLVLAQWRERQKRRRTEDEREWARDRRKHCQGALKSQKKKTRKREREKKIEEYLPHASMTFNNPHAIPSAPLRVKLTTLDAFVFSGCTHMFERNGKAGRKRLG